MSETRQASPCRETGDSHMQIETENKTALQSSGVPGSLTMGDGEVAVIGIDIGPRPLKSSSLRRGGMSLPGAGGWSFPATSGTFFAGASQDAGLLRRVQPLVGESTRPRRQHYPAPPGWDWHARQISRSSRRFLPPPKPCAGWNRTHPPSLNWAGGCQDHLLRRRIG